MMFDVNLIIAPSLSQEQAGMLEQAPHAVFLWHTFHSAFAFASDVHVTHEF